MRKNESYEIGKVFNEKLNLNHIHIDASEKFISKLNGISDPEQKEELLATLLLKCLKKKLKK